MQKLCCVRTRQHPLPVWSHKFVISSPTHISTNSCPFLVGIVSLEDGLYRFKSIKDHKGPYTASDAEYNGSSYNLLIEWETGEHTWEPLSNIIASDPYTCAVYAKEHELLNTPGWKLLKRQARTARRLIRTLKKSK